MKCMLPFLVVATNPFHLVNTESSLKHWQQTWKVIEYNIAVFFILVLWSDGDELLHSAIWCFKSPRMSILYGMGSGPWTGTWTPQIYEYERSHENVEVNELQHHRMTWSSSYIHRHLASPKINLTQTWTLLTGYIIRIIAA